MAGHSKHFQNLKSIYFKSIKAVKPKYLLADGDRCDLVPRLRAGKSCINIQATNVDITNKKCHVAGFGKAVLGMAVQLENSLGEFLVGGILSIPKGSGQQFKDMPEMTLRSNTSIKIYEGAHNNQPDDDALEAAKKIKKLAESMTKADILFVLISGGGSALLPLPKSPLQLEEKMQLIRKLSNCGASIQELNTVRIALSAIKGGQLALAAAQAHAVISLVISDIVGDPVDLIASGPTCVSQASLYKATEILKAYNLWEDADDHIKFLLQAKTAVDIDKINNSSIFIVGDNKMATAAAAQQALKLNYQPFLASTSIQGDVALLTSQYCDFLNSLYDFKEGLIKEQELVERFPFDKERFPSFLKTLLISQEAEQPLLLIMGGEPTVKVSGIGVGGRNQELAMRLSREFFLQPRLRNVCFLSAGTDGIDGPCSAAGAIGSAQVILDFMSNKSKALCVVEEFIKNNDSYNFYKNVNDGQYHIITGHTGTNVMDLHLLLIL